MTNRTYRITTLGCRVNHAEARAFESILHDRGLVRAAPGDPSDLEIVHTCSVTGSAGAKSRQAIRRAGRSWGPEGTPSVIVTGCYAGTNPAEVEALGPAEVIPHDGDDGSPLSERFGATIDAWLASSSTAPPQTTSAVRTNTSPNHPEEEGQSGVLPLPVITPHGPAGRHVRAEVHIQDGCDAFCTFCIIPSIRPTLRSKRIGDVVREVRDLVDLGHREIVLTGIFIGAYGHETALRRKQKDAGAPHLADLLDAVARVSGLERVRLSSMEPGDVSDALLDAMCANAPVVVPHLHLPLQSGSDRVLGRMNRQYRVGDYLKMIGRVEAALTVDGLGPAITTDIICGFPGETDEDFARTLEVVERVGYLHMHVFPYSARAGTAAARWRHEHVAGAVARQRVRTLIDRETDPDRGLSITFRRRLVGRRVRVILEQPDRDRPGWMTGRCDHYALVHMPIDLPRGRLVDAVIERVDRERTIGRIIDAPIRLGVLPSAVGAVT